MEQKTLAELATFLKEGKEPINKGRLIRLATLLGMREPATCTREKIADRLLEIDSHFAAILHRRG